MKEKSVIKWLCEKRVKTEPVNVADHEVDNPEENNVNDCPISITLDY